MRAIRRFIEEEERPGSRVSSDQGAPSGKETKSGATYQVVEQPSAVVREEEFARQLRIARYLAGASLPAARPLEPADEVRARKDRRSVRTARSKTKKETPRQKAGKMELAKERRRAGQAGRQKVPSSSPRGSERQRPSPGR